MQIPGALWAALLTALPLLAVWLNEFFPGAIWAAPVAGLLLIVAKTIEVLRPAPVTEQGARAAEDEEQDRSAYRRWLLG